MRSKTHLARLMQAQARAAAEVRNQPGGPGRWVGKIVKIGFPTEDAEVSREWMWVEVHSVGQDGKLCGVLLNTPFFTSKVKHRDGVTLDESEIIAVSA